VCDPGRRKNEEEEEGEEEGERRREGDIWVGISSRMV